MQHLKHFRGVLTKQQIEEFNLSKTVLDPGPHPQAMVTLWLIFGFSSTFLLAILLVTFIVSKKLKRHITLHNMLLTFLLSGITYSLLFYADRWRLDQISPSPALCLTQASLIYAAGPMTAASSLALIYQMWWTFYRPLRALKSDRPSGNNERLRTAVLIITPYIIFTVTGTATFVVGYLNPESVDRQRRMFYCAVAQKTLTNCLAILTGTLCCITAFFAVWTTYIMYQSWRALSPTQRKAAGPDRQSMFRISLFAFYIMLGLTLSFTGIKNQRTIVPDMFASTIPLAIFFIFATQPDVLLVWAEWLHIRRAKPRKRSDSDSRFQSTLSPTESFDSTNLGSKQVLHRVATIEKSLPTLPDSNSRFTYQGDMMDNRRSPDDEESALYAGKRVLQVQPNTPSARHWRTSFNRGSTVEAASNSQGALLDVPMNSTSIRIGVPAGNGIRIGSGSERQTPIPVTLPKFVKLPTEPQSGRSTPSARWI